MHTSCERPALKMRTAMLAPRRRRLLLLADARRAATLELIHRAFARRRIRRQPGAGRPVATVLGGPLDGVLC